MVGSGSVQLLRRVSCFDSHPADYFQMSEKAANDDLDDIVNSIENVSVGQDKKKKKKNKKKKDESAVEQNGDGEQTVESAQDAVENTEETQASKKKKNKKKKGAAVQTDPPTVPVKDLFPSGQFPVGQIMDHPIAQADTTAKNR